MLQHNIETVDYNPDNDLGLQERQLMIQLTGAQKRLDYKTESIRLANGCIVEKYLIPEIDKQKVLDMLYPFADPPALDDEQIDIHTNKSFKVRDYIVTREGDGNFLMSPYYAEAGGTVLDWIRPAEKEGKSRQTQMNIGGIGTIYLRTIMK